MEWQARLSNGIVLTEQILAAFDNPNKLTPWLVLLEYCENNKLTLKDVVLWDSNTSVRLYTPGKLSSKLPDNIDYRRRYVAEGMASNTPTELHGLIITKDSVSFGIWFNNLTKEVFTTIE